MKRFLLILSMITCLCLMAACGTDQTDETASGTADTAQYQTYAEQLLTQIVEMDDATIDSYLLGGQLPDGLASALTSWKSIREELGAFESITKTVVTMDDGTANIVIDVKFAKREGTYTMAVDQEGNVTSASFDKVYTTAEIFKKAALNTMMGMGTVFAVLIFISFIISLFKYIPDVQAKFAKKSQQAVQVEESQPAANVQPQTADDSDLMSDGELVAVITAAVCAAMAGEGNAVSKDGLVVRSIRRSRK